jgi:SSS family solute:Na+ symporter
VLVPEVVEAKASGDPNFDCNNSMLYLVRDVLPGIGMLLFAVAFALWSRLRPVAVEVEHEETATGD